jgi:hypothetical protein
MSTDPYALVEEWFAEARLAEPGARRLVQDPPEQAGEKDHRAAEEYDE